MGEDLGVRRFPTHGQGVIFNGVAQALMPAAPRFVSALRTEPQ